MLTTREQVAHVYRRLGFGGTLSEIEEGVKRGVNKTIDLLIDCDEAELDVHPYEYIWREKEEADPGTHRFRAWWMLQMVAGTRPFQEKLALFWHDHFAVSDGKVEFGPMMLEYIQNLRSLGTGKFDTLLSAMSKEPAMMQYLDMQRAFKGHPNENFAREIMELFTLGIGNYSEKDVQEASRALTGWGYINTYWELQGDNTARMSQIIKDNRPVCTFTNMPPMRDTGQKEILGKKGDIDGDELITILAKHPKTAEHISRKLWEYFAYPDPEPEVVKRAAKVFEKTGGNVREVVRSIAKSKEFKSDRAHRAIVKCPVDYSVGIMRKCGFGEHLKSLHTYTATKDKAIPQPMVDQPAGLGYFIGRQGMEVLYPPDVAGWNWGQGWISAQNLLERVNFYGIVVWAEEGRWIKPLWEHLKTSKPTNAVEAARAVNAFLDAGLPEKSLELVAKAMDGSGKADFVGNWDAYRGAMHRSLKVLFAAPEFQMM